MKPLSIIQMVIDALVKPKQHISIPVLPEGNILDIGGGGEGVIARAGGARMIAIDKYMSEIQEAKAKIVETPWVVTDGTALPFAVDSFDNATVFFSCMYMSEEIKRKVFQETWRVLKNGGEFWIWDSNIPPHSKVFAIRLQVDIQQYRSIKTMYGVKAIDQSAAIICGQLREAGFEAEVITNHKHWFFIKALRV